MGSVYYRDLEHTNSNEEREQFIKRAEDYLKDNLYINYETGEFYDNYPTDFKDSQKSRTRKAKGKMENPNSYVSRLFENLGDQGLLVHSQSRRRLYILGKVRDSIRPRTNKEGEKAS